jgi:hypothetical protein
MKRISFFLALTLVIFSFGLASAEQSIRTIEDPSSFWTDGSNTYMSPQTTVVWDLRIINTPGDGCMYNPGFTYVVSSTDGAEWTGMAFELLPVDFGGKDWAAIFASQTWWDDALYPGGDQPNGMVSDTMGVQLAAFGPPALGDGWDFVCQRITIGPIPLSDTDKTVCLAPVDNNTVKSGWELRWNGFTCDNVDPVFAMEDGTAWPAEGACYVVKKQPDQPPVFDPPSPTSLNGSHCALITGDYNAHDPDGTDAITFSLNGAPAGATIDPTSGAFEWQPSLADVNTSISFFVVATESDGTASQLAVNVVVTNQAPTFNANQCDKEYPVQMDVEFIQPFAATDNCTGDPKIFSVTDDGGMPNTLLEFQGNELHVIATAEGLYTIGIEVSDGVDATPCSIVLNVTAGAPFQFRIEKTENTPQGQFVGVNMFVDNNINDDFGGFNFLVAYDASALTFQGADVDNSPLFQACEWEYFTYRFGPDGNCGSGCPSGLLRVVGIAETNNGPHHPACLSIAVPPSYILFTMNFLVSNDRTLECSYVPIRFYWIECGDNTVSNGDGSKLYISSRVFDYIFDPDLDYQQQIADPSVGFPTYQGAQAECLTEYKVPVEDKVDFFNGGVDIVCGKDVDDRGDINLDGLAYTIADAVMFTNYFIEGISAFDTHSLGSIAASDINADGIALSVADLVYLIRVIVGDAQPYATGFLKPATVNAVYHIDNGVVNVEEAMGAAVLHIAGDVTPVLLADNMEMKYAYNAEKNVTSAVVYSLKNNNFTGDFIDARGDVIDIEMATAKGNPVNGSLIPSNFALLQNYPNPFNPTTTISFTLAAASDYQVEIYNLVGQQVKAFAGHSEAGTVSVEWDASNNASGVYFYKLTAGNFSATKKMVLLK